MNYLFIVARRPVFSELPGLLAEVGRVDVNGHSQIEVHGPPPALGYLRVEQFPAAELEDPIPPEGADWLRPTDKPETISILYGGLELCRAAAARVASAHDIWIDNDCDFSGTGADFLDRLRAQPSWDWHAKYRHP